MPNIQIADTINPRTLLFKPRQVLLSETNMKSSRTLKPEQKTSLLHSIAGYLQSNGFSKTLKKFRSEAHLEKDGNGESIISLEDMFCNYLETCDYSSKSISGLKMRDARMDGNSVRDKEADFAAGAEIVCKKKKKRCDEDSHGIVGQSEDNMVPELNLKSKDKKKKKKTSDSQGQLEQVSAEAMKEPVDSVVCDQQLQEPDKKRKEKKKKKSKLDSESVVENVEHHGNTTELDVGKSSRTESKEDDSKTLDKDATDKESKQSKKRKRLAAEENNSQLDKIVVEESKRRKTKGSEELKGSEQVTELNGTVGNSNIKREGEKSASHKHTKEQANGSAEPKTVKAFQRVKVDEVVFTDERLKDNSYWAKAGAEDGYGAKAQEVLGQVRGRDFRHEKTKKKRGSYRGGLIDVQSHSIKFNYSDEE